MVLDLAEKEAENAAEMRELDKQENDLLEKLLLPNPTEIAEENDNLEEGEEDEDQVVAIDTEKKVNIQEKKRAWQDDDDLDESKKLQNNRLKENFTKGFEEKVFKGEKYQERLDEVFVNSYKQPSWMKSKKQKIDRDGVESDGQARRVQNFCSGQT